MNSKHRIEVTKLDKKQIAKMFGYSESEIVDTLEEMVDKGFFKRIDKETYDVSPFLRLQVRFQEEMRKGNNVDIKKMCYEITGVHIL